MLVVSPYSTILGVIEKMTNVTVIGGSIAGCLASLVLGRQGYDTNVFERTDASLVDRGGACNQNLFVIETHMLAPELVCEPWMNLL